MSDKATDLIHCEDARSMEAWFRSKALDGWDYPMSWIEMVHVADKLAAALAGHERIQGFTPPAAAPSVVPSDNHTGSSIPRP